MIDNRKEVISMDNPLKAFLPTPHWSKAVFKANGVPFSAVAKGLGFSYAYTCNLLSGVCNVTPEVEARLEELVKQFCKDPRSLER